MLRMRLQRRGKKNFATYRVVVAEQRAPIKGRSVADLGPYNPHTNEIKVDKDAVTEWIAKGVKPTATVNNLLIEHGLLKGEKMTSWKPKKRPEPEEEGAAEKGEKKEEAKAESTDAGEAKEEVKAEEKEEDNN